MSASHGAAARLGHPQRLVELDPAAVGADQRAGLDPNHGNAGGERYAALGENALEMPTDAAVVRRQQRLAGDESDLDRAIAQPRQSILRRQGQLDAAGPAADHGEPQPRQAPGARDERFPARRELGDRLDRNRVLGRTRNIVGARCRADVERQKIPADRRMGAARYAAVGAVDTDRLVADQPRAGKARQPAEVDMALVEIVVAGDPARQHAGIRGLDIAGDQGHPHAGIGRMPKLFSTWTWAWPPPTSTRVLSDRNRLLASPPYAAARRRRRAGRRPASG